MAGTKTPDREATGDTRFRLRRKVYDELTAERNASTIKAQLELTGVPRRTLMRIRAGGPPSIASAMQIADALDVPVNDLFERVSD